ncbi:DNA-binding protein [Entophlyctis helioformis]|nr:DNA-binding protein [Entophlyctis helioformis]
MMGTSRLAAATLPATTPATAKAAAKATAATGKSTGAISLEGSASIVLEFFKFSINNILYLRGLYPPESFSTVKKYGLSLFIASDDAVTAYLEQILAQVQNWVSARSISKFVMVISSKDTGLVLERWQFDVRLEGQAARATHNAQTPAAASALQARTKTEKEIHTEIAAIMRQISASVSFLPELSDPCTFNVLVYTDRDADVPETWIDSDARLITHNAEQVRLRSFNTTMHQIEGLVAYRLDMDAA